MRDDSVGVRAVEEMNKLRLSDEVELRDGGTAGLDLESILAYRRKVVVIDAMQAAVEPGTVVRLTSKELIERTEGGITPHEAGLLDALMVSRRLESAPEEVVILAVRPKEVSLGTEQTEEISAMVPRLIELALAELPCHLILGGERADTEW